MKNHEPWGESPLALLGKEADLLFAKVLVHQHVTDACLVAVAVQVVDVWLRMDAFPAGFFHHGAGKSVSRVYTVVGRKLT